MSTKTQHTPTPFNPESMGFAVRDILREHGWAENAQEYCKRAVNAHEELIAEMQMAVNELGKDWQSCDTRDVGAECLGEKCVLAEHRVICHLEKAIAKAEGRQ